MHFDYEFRNISDAKTFVWVVSNSIGATPSEYMVQSAEKVESISYYLNISNYSLRISMHNLDAKNYKGVRNRPINYGVTLKDFTNNKDSFKPQNGIKVKEFVYVYHTKNRLKKIAETILHLLENGEWDVTIAPPDYINPRIKDNNHLSGVSNCNYKIGDIIVYKDYEDSVFQIVDVRKNSYIVIELGFSPKIKNEIPFSDNNKLQFAVSPLLTTEIKLLELRNNDLLGLNTSSLQNTELQLLKSAIKSAVDYQTILNNVNSNPSTPLTATEKYILRQYKGDGGNKNSANEGILHEFYTPTWVCNLMYQLAKKYGYKTGNILEPSAATGNIIRPYVENNDFQNIDCFEINSESSKICKALYPQTNVYNQYFETAFLQPPRYTSFAKSKWLNNYPYDLVTGNPPYCPHKNKYSGYFTGKDNFKQTEMFFIYKSLQMLKIGGLLVFITNINFMSTGDTYQTAKDRIGGIAELVDAYRLPSVFEKTEVCTDIIVLRKI